MDHNNENSCILIDGYFKLKFYETGLISSKALVHLTEINSSNCIIAFDSIPCQISKKGIHYSSIQGHLLYSHTSPSPVKLNRDELLCIG
ncbi:hypothetical protein T09_6607 [Trichinella sp. T9]|nr:hypothetical protein T09_6607 [Trichinella sp. T9]